MQIYKKYVKQAILKSVIFVDFDYIFTFAMHSFRIALRSIRGPHRDGAVFCFFPYCLCIK